MHARLELCRLREKFQHAVNVGQLIHQDNIQRMISDEQIFALAENVRRASQNVHKANE